MDTTDAEHTYRLEKHGQTEIRLFVDDVLQLSWPYDALPARLVPGRAVLAATSASGQSGFRLRRFRYRIGGVSFDEKPQDPTGCEADFHQDGVVDIADLIFVVMNWGCVGCGLGVGTGEPMGIVELILVVTEWGPTFGCDDG